MVSRGKMETRPRTCKKAHKVPAPCHLKLVTCYPSPDISIVRILSYPTSTVPAMTSIRKGTDTVNKREQLAQWTSLVADTGDLDMIAELAPEDATTNPSLLLAAARDERYRPMLQQAADLCRTLGHGDEMDWLTDCFACLAGLAYLACLSAISCVAMRLGDY